MNPIVIGIDLGTTFCAMAYVGDDGRLNLIKTPGDQQTMPSVVLINGDRIVVGDAAMNQWAIDPDHVVRWIKRSMGDPDYLYARRFLFPLDASFAEDLDGQALTDSIRTQFRVNGIALSSEAYALVRTAGYDWVVHDDDTAYAIRQEDDGLQVHEGMSAVEISAAILRTLKEQAETQLGQPVDEAVITCPAYFNTNEIAKTKRAGELAGFRVREIIKEPIAAAVCYGIERMRNGERTMACDLGGGTFDATILELQDGRFEPIETMGDRKLGGHDWTMALVDLVADRFRQLTGEDPRNDPVGRQRLYEACEQGKRDFLHREQVEITCFAAGHPEEITVARGEFEAATAGLVAQMMLQCEGVLKKADMKWTDMDRILLVGGSSRLLAVKRALTEAFGKSPEMSPTPDLMVAYGAAIMAKGKVRPRKIAGGLTEVSHGGLVEVVSSRKIPRSFGTRAYDRDLKRVTNVLMIPHGTEAPVDHSDDDFEIAADGQEFFDVPVVEFESDDDYECIRCYRCRCPRDVRQGDRVRLTFHYDCSGILTAEAHSAKTGQKFELDMVKYEEPTEMTISIKPRWVVFALDLSWSMQGEKLANAKKALIDNADQLLHCNGSECKVGIVTFASHSAVACRPTANIDEIRPRVQALEVSGTTAMDEGIREAATLVLGAPAGTDRDVVLLTDGMPDDEETTRRAAAQAKKDHITLSVVAIEGDGVDMDYLRSLTPLTLKVDAKGISDGLPGILSRAAQTRGLMDA